MIARLPNELAIKIAAGEVVTRPASVVKELLENSVDAGATFISVNIENGGVERIRVTDNGGAIAACELRLALEKHTTSKLSSEFDLERIGSLGFRGEALFSIAAVSKLTIKTQKAGQTGALLKVSGGVEELYSEGGFADGTSVTVEELFYNVPARRKFLSKPQTEAAAVSDVVRAAILSRPDIAFKYASGGSTIYHSPGDGSLQNAVFSVFGMQARGQLLDVNYTLGKVRVSGVIGTPSLTLQSRKNQQITVNTRPVACAFIANTVKSAYGQTLMRGTNPFFVLNISTPPESVDVNIHPAKAQVRFLSESEVQTAVYEAVSFALSGARVAPTIVLKPTETLPTTIKSPPSDYDVDAAILAIMGGSDEEIPQTLAQSFTPEVIPDIFKDEEPNHEFSLNFPEIETPQIAAPIVDMTADVKILGIGLNTYIIAEQGETLYFIDQHAAAERLRYDELLATDVVSQPLLVPEILTLSHSEYDTVIGNQSAFLNLGFEVEPFGTLSIKISALPVVLGKTDIRRMIRDLLENIAGAKAVGEDIIARAACRSSIKAGDTIPLEYAKQLVLKLNAGVTPHCPHGRPIMIALTKTELERSFRRIIPPTTKLCTF